MDKHFLEKYRKEIIEEYSHLAKYKDVHKDIFIIVHNQLDYIKRCIESIYSNTDNFSLYIWDNGSDEETTHYLMSCPMKYQEFIPNKNIDITRIEQNIGFIVSNNTLAKLSKAEYIILLNSDTEVYENWDKALISFLQNHKDVSAVSYLGGFLDEKGMGVPMHLLDNACFEGYGYNIDYLHGYCFCLSRQVYKKFGLFDDKNLTFAYCEDSDFSLRLKEANRKIYALHLGLVKHYGNVTIKEVAKTKMPDLQKSFESNHRYLQQRWEKYLKKDRILHKRRKKD